MVTDADPNAGSGIDSGIGRGIRYLPPLLAILPQSYAWSLVRSWQGSCHCRTFAMMEPRIVPHESASAPIMISRLCESMKQMPQAAQPRGFRLSAA